MNKVSFQFSGFSTTQSIVLPNMCPRCGTKIKPVILHAALNSTLYNNSDKENGHIVLGCTSCYRPFVGTVEHYQDAYSDYWTVHNLQPITHIDQDFDDAIKTISPDFVNIYNQALAAESHNLNHISGMGYRKALEFLVKDYAIHLHPDKEEEIKDSRLGACIKVYIEFPKIKATAKAASWLGNDETHYVRKWEDKDITDLKRFINSCVHFIIADYDASEAEGMISGDVDATS